MYRKGLTYAELVFGEYEVSSVVYELDRVRFQVRD